MNKKNIIYAVILIVGLVFLANGLVLAWDWPSEDPIGGNTPPPLADPADSTSFAVGTNGGMLEVGYGGEYWIGKNGDSFVLYNSSLYNRLELGQDGALTVLGGGQTKSDQLFKIRADGVVEVNTMEAGSVIADSIEIDSMKIDDDKIYFENDSRYYLDLDSTSNFRKVVADSIRVMDCSICIGWADLNHSTPDREQCHPLSWGGRRDDNFLQLGGKVGDDDRLWLWLECDF